MTGTLSSADLACWTQRTCLRELATVVDASGLAPLTLLITAEKSLSSGLIVSASTISPPPFLKAVGEGGDQSLAVGLLVMNRGDLLLALVEQYFAANGPWTSSVVQVRK
jgi:hypothetical protein